MSIRPVDVLVFVPHPDDEVIGAGGIIQQALAAGRTVRIVFATSGDAYPKAASALFHKPISALGSSDYVSLAATRQREAVAAGHVLCVSASNLVFLGYPDAALAAVYSNVSGAPTESPTTGQRSTYGPAQTDYHTLAHGQPAPYMRSSAIADIEEILRESRPDQVYVTDRADDHADHSAIYRLVRDAAAAAGYRGALLTFVVHSGSNECWPWPQGATPNSPLEPHTIAATTYPIGVPWPPPIRVALTPAQAVKLQAIAMHESQCAIDGPYLESFVKSEEVFWTGR
jgi:LmbE family N-acetylglucosaminyl deacetylase